jgi:glycosyl transferase family 25
MARLGLAFEFLDAVEAADLSDDECQMAADSWPSATFRQDIACFHSHRLAWRKAASDGRLTLILEDDAVLCEGIGQSLQSISSRHSQWNHVYDLEFIPELHIISDRPTWQDDEGGISARQIYRNRFGLAGYIIGPEAARRMLADTGRYALIDCYFWHRSWLNAQQIEPAQVVQMRFLKGQEAQDLFLRSPDERTFKPSSRVRKLAMRLRIELERARALLAAAFRATKRQPRIDWAAFAKPAA